MGNHSALASKSLGIGVEQVSVFLIADKTVISFFESSTDDVETPIMKRLSTPDTIFRRCSDASMVTQAILDMWSSILQCPSAQHIRMQLANESSMSSQTLTLIIPLHFTFSLPRLLNSNVILLPLAVWSVRSGFIRVNLYARQVF